MTPCLSPGCPLFASGRSSYCSECSVSRSRGRARSRQHHRSPEYRRASAAVRDAARANPGARCATCGLLAGAVDDDGRWLGPWVAGHQDDGTLAAEHKLCNERKGRTDEVLDRRRGR